MTEGLIVVDQAQVGMYRVPPNFPNYVTETLTTNENVSIGHWKGYYDVGEGILVNDDVAGAIEDSSNDIAAAFIASGVATFVVGLTSFAIPAGHIVASVAARARFVAVNGPTDPIPNFGINLVVGTEQHPTDLFHATPDTEDGGEEFFGSAFNTQPNGQPWTQAAIDNLRVKVQFVAGISGDAIGECSVLDVQVLHHAPTPPDTAPVPRELSSSRGAITRLPAYLGGDAYGLALFGASDGPLMVAFFSVTTERKFDLGPLAEDATGSVANQAWSQTYYETSRTPGPFGGGFMWGNIAAMPGHFIADATPEDPAPAPNGDASFRAAYIRSNRFSRVATIGVVSVLDDEPETNRGAVRPYSLGGSKGFPIICDGGGSFLSFSSCNAHIMPIGRRRILVFADWVRGSAPFPKVHEITLTNSDYSETNSWNQFGYATVTHSRIVYPDQSETPPEDNPPGWEGLGLVTGIGIVAGYVAPTNSGENAVAFVQCFAYSEADTPHYRPDEPVFLNIAPGNIEVLVMPNDATETPGQIVVGGGGGVAYLTLTHTPASDPVLYTLTLETTVFAGPGDEWAMGANKQVAVVRAFGGYYGGFFGADSARRLIRDGNNWIGPDDRVVKIDHTPYQPAVRVSAPTWMRDGWQATYGPDDEEPVWGFDLFVLGDINGSSNTSGSQWLSLLLTGTAKAIRTGSLGVS